MRDGFPTRDLRTFLKGPCCTWITRKIISVGRTVKDQDDEEDFEIRIDGEGEADEKAVEDDTELENDDAQNLCDSSV